MKPQNTFLCFCLVFLFTGFIFPDIRAGNMHPAHAYQDSTAYQSFQGKILDSQTGKPLWRSRLNDVPSAAPISYMAKGKQYIAMVVGYGSGWTVTFPKLTPEIALPHASSSAIFVFALPDNRKD